MFTVEALTGRIVVFDHEGRRRVGQITRAVPLPPTPRGKIPNMMITVKGRSGREIQVDYVECHCDVFDTWAEGIAAAESK